MRDFCSARVVRTHIRTINMINRTLVRTRVVQTLFAHYKNPGQTPLSTRKDLLKSFADTYDLYFSLLDFANVLTAYAQEQLQDSIARAKATHTPFAANRRFVNNRLAQQLFDNRALRRRIEEQQLTWDSGATAVSEVYKLLIESEDYKAYMASPEDNYEQDKQIWRRIYQNMLPMNEALHDALSDLEVALDKTNWENDAEIVLSYIVKTIKRFNEDSTPEQELLPMFDNEEELQFATRLLDAALSNHEQYEQLINSNLRGWDADRIAYMDRIIIEVALAEILEFPDIALTVSLNEYIELSKEYSGDKSYMFVNGILNEILRNMKHDGSCPKALTLK